MYGVTEEALRLEAEGYNARDHEWSLDFLHDQANYTVVLRDNGNALRTIEIRRKQEMDE